MARPIHGLLRSLLPACLLVLVLHQVSVECSTTPPSPSPAADHLDDDALHHQLQLHAEARTALPPTSTEVAGDGRTGAEADAAVPSASATTPAPAVPAAVVVASSSAAAATMVVLPARTSARPEVLLRSKLARRFLAAAGGVDEAASSSTDGAAPSCHSNNPHNNCPPASKP